MKTFDTTPKPAFLRAMQNQKWTVAGAVAELVDNSLGSGRGNADHVEIIYHVRDRTLTVIDNGQGMEAVGRLFQLGNTIGRSPGDIGIYGSGGTMAILWLPRRVEVWSLRDNMISHDAVIWADEIKAERFPIISDEWTPSTLGNTPLQLREHAHGTLIRLHLAPERRFTISNVKRDLARMYSPAIRHGKRIIWTTTGTTAGGTDTLSDPIAFPTDPVTFNVAVDINDEQLLVTGAIGVVPDLPQEHSRVNIGFGPRVIDRTRDCYASPDGAKHYSGTGVTGWLDLEDGWQPYLSTTKDGINDSRAWDALMGHVFEKIEPLLEAVQRERLTIELDDIAIMLETVLDGTASVEIPASAKPNDAGEPNPTPSPDPQPAPPPRPRDKTPDDDGDNTDHDDKGRTRIIIWPQNDADMQGILCYAELSSKEIFVYINEEHEVVKQALIRKPVNRALLHWMVVREIAAELADDDKIAQQVFRPKIAKLIKDKEGRQREGLITRILLDRVVA